MTLDAPNLLRRTLILFVLLSLFTPWYRVHEGGRALSGWFILGSSPPIPGWLVCRALLALLVGGFTLVFLYYSMDPAPDHAASQAYRAFLAIALLSLAALALATGPQWAWGFWLTGSWIGAALVTEWGLEWRLDHEEGHLVVPSLAEGSFPTHPLARYDPLHH